MASRTRLDYCDAQTARISDIDGRFDWLELRFASRKAAITPTASLTCVSYARREDAVGESFDLRKFDQPNSRPSRSPFSRHFAISALKALMPGAYALAPKPSDPGSKWPSLL